MPFERLQKGFCADFPTARQLSYSESGQLRGYLSRHPSVDLDQTKDSQREPRVTTVSYVPSAWTPGWAIGLCCGAPREKRNRSRLIIPAFYQFAVSVVLHSSNAFVAFGYPGLGGFCTERMISGMWDGRSERSQRRKQIGLHGCNVTGKRNAAKAEDIDRS